MRCKNCGWPNKPSESTCVKCGSPLSSAEDHDDFTSRSNGPESSIPLNKTIIEGDVFKSVKPKEANNASFKQTRIDTVDSLSQCPKCGYPVRPGVDKCPNCKFQIVPAQQEETNSHASSWEKNGADDRNLRPTRMAGGNGARGAFRGTINPYMMNIESEPSFILKPIKRVDERHGFEEIEYEGKQVVLNRENTEQNNPSITSKEQAIITCSDGHWYIEDKSEQKTTFVQAAHKIELQDGDIVLLGNRLFEFHK